MNREAVPDFQPNVAAGLRWEWKRRGTTMNREAVRDLQPNVAAGLCWEWKSGGTTMNREAVPDLQPNVAAQRLRWELDNECELPRAVPDLQLNVAALRLRWELDNECELPRAVPDLQPNVAALRYVGSWITNANYRERFLTSSPTLPQAYVGNGKGRNHNEPRSGSWPPAQRCRAAATLGTEKKNATYREAVVSIPDVFLIPIDLMLL